MLSLALRSTLSKFHAAMPVNLLTLPRELRDQIWDRYLSSGLKEPHLAHYLDIGAFRELINPLAKVNKLIRGELIERFYAGSNRFHLLFDNLESKRFFFSSSYCPEHLRHKLRGESTFAGPRQFRGGQ